MQAPRYQGDLYWFNRAVLIALFTFFGPIIVLVFFPYLILWPLDYIAPALDRSRSPATALPTSSPAPVAFDPGVEHGDLIVATAIKYGLDPALYLAQIEQESGFTNGLTSESGALGLGQLMPVIYGWCGIDAVTALHDAAANLDCSGRFMADLKAKYNGDNLMMLAAYYRGEPIIDACMCIDPAMEYIQPITARWQSHWLPIYNQQRAAAAVAAPQTAQDGPGQPAAGKIASIYQKGWWSTQGTHTGLDVDLKRGCGSKVFSPITGVVVYNGNDGYVTEKSTVADKEIGYATPGGGNTQLDIVSDDGVMAVQMLHGHWSLPAGTAVVAGVTQVGTEASEGNSSGCHTHLQLRVNGVEVYPYDYME